MKTILLNTASTDNAGARREAGESIAVGDGKKQINADRAQALVDNGGAADKAAKK